VGHNAPTQGIITTGPAQAYHQGYTPSLEGDGQGRPEGGGQAARMCGLCREVEWDGDSP
jgi:hypothetical protein